MIYIGVSRRYSRFLEEGSAYHDEASAEPSFQECRDNSRHCVSSRNVVVRHACGRILELCGIAGLSYPDAGLIQTMCGALIHRGPDDDGYFVDDQVSLGVRRLSIIDVSGGKQPISNEDSTIHVVFNGEIYNFGQLTIDLKRLGHSFKTRSDTEVIVHAYEEYGERFLDKLNGMFALCVYDKRRTSLLVARDRFGEKPLFYCMNKGKFAFASELKALLFAGLASPSPNLAVVADFLINGELPEGKAETFFEEIYKLRPGSFAVFENGKLRVEKYYLLRPVLVPPLFDQAIEEKLTVEFFSLFKEAIKMRLVSEVRVGTSLSGGIDSTSIASIINELVKERSPEASSIGGRQQCFSAVYTGFVLDERDNIEAFQESTGVDCHFVSPNSKDLWSELPRIVYHQDEPFETTSVYAQWVVMREASKHVTVMIDGQGAEPMVGGYYVHYILYLRELLEKGHVLRFVQQGILGFTIIRSLLRSYLKDNARGDYAKGLAGSALLQNLAVSEMNAIGKTLSERTTRDMFSRMGNLLRYEDRNSMAFSVESRLPFLDPALVSFTQSLPSSMKARNGYLKFILRRAMAGRVPKQILHGRKKIAFDVPDVKWLNELRQEVTALFNSREFEQRGFYNAQEVKVLFQRFCEGKLPSYYAGLFWRIIILETWSRVFLDSAYVPLGNMSSGVRR